MFYSEIFNSIHLFQESLAVFLSIFHLTSLLYLCLYGLVLQGYPEAGARQVGWKASLEPLPAH